HRWRPDRSSSTRAPRRSRSSGSGTTPRWCWRRGGSWLWRLPASDAPTPRPAAPAAARSPKRREWRRLPRGRPLDAAAAPGPGVSEQALRNRVAARLPSDLRAKTGDQVRKDDRNSVSQSLSFVNTFLLAFGLIALIVGTFIIYNTFSMIIAQRVRELALLRAIGASRQQIGRSVVSEAFVIGLIGSAIGLVAGVGLAFGLSAVLNAFDLGLPTGSMAVRPRTIVVGLLVGLLVTMVSAYAPARRASRIPPVEAMREEFASVGESLR